MVGPWSLMILSIQVLQYVEGKINFWGIKRRCIEFNIFTLKVHGKIVKGKKTNKQKPTVHCQWNLVCKRSLRWRFFYVKFSKYPAFFKMATKNCIKFSMFSYLSDIWSHHFQNDHQTHLKFLNKTFYYIGDQNSFNCMVSVWEAAFPLRIMIYCICHWIK